MALTPTRVCLSLAALPGTKSSFCVLDHGAMFTIAKKEAGARLAVRQKRLVLRARHLHRLELQRRDALCAQH